MPAASKSTSGKAFFSVLRRAENARRKTLRNALPEIDFEAAGIDPKLRPENLSPEDYARLSMNSIL